MLDIHSHFLPKMDDGSKSTEMSMQMLRESRRQGVTTIVSTSHFYGDNDAPERFLKRRQHAFNKLTPLISKDDPEILLGAEILYYPGISHSESITQLAIEGTDLILIEMPFVRWSDNIFDELITFQYQTGLHVILAHVERYQGIQKHDVYERLFDQPFYFQCNAGAFTSFRSRRLALKLMDNDLLHFIGTDCHNTDKRPPNMYEAQKIVEKKLSPSEWRRFTRACTKRFNEHRI
jgi:protein-tyrosine phosphatase